MRLEKARRSPCSWKRLCTAAERAGRHRKRRAGSTTGSRAFQEKRKTRAVDVDLRTRRRNACAQAVQAREEAEDRGKEGRPPGMFDQRNARRRGRDNFVESPEFATSPSRSRSVSGSWDCGFRSCVEKGEVRGRGSWREEEWARRERKQEEEGKREAEDGNGKREGLVTAGSWCSRDAPAFRRPAVPLTQPLRSLAAAKFSSARLADRLLSLSRGHADLARLLLPYDIAE